VAVVARLAMNVIVTAQVWRAFFLEPGSGWYVSSPNWGAATTAIFNYFWETCSKSIALLSGSTQLIRASQDISIFDF
jgi:hypothetical protein